MTSNDNYETSLNPTALIDSTSNGDISLHELFTAIWQGKWLITAITTVFVAISAIYALSLPNFYKSEVLLAPVAEESDLKMPGQLGGLAALAGVNLGNGGEDKTKLALEIIKSREFLGRFIQKHDLFVPLMAAKDWRLADNSLVIDPSIYESSTQQWVRKVQPPYQSKPSLLEAHEKLSEFLSISQDNKSGMIKLSIEYLSPYLAKQWVGLLVDSINNEMRKRELAEAQSSIAYLSMQLEATTVADIRTMLFSLIEEQTKTVMLANVRKEYVFKTVDPAVVSEKKSKPARAFICILGLMLGGMLSIAIVLIRHFNRR